MNQSNEIMHLDRAKRELALANSIDEVKEIHDRAEALRNYAKAADLSLEMQNLCAELRLRAERKAGELLKEEIKPGNPQLSSDSTIGKIKNLSDFGLSRYNSSTWQKIASIPEPEFENFLTEQKENKEEITTASALRLHYEINKEAEAKEEKERLDKMEIQDNSRIILGKMEDEIPKLEEGIADLILTDPPYGLGDTADIKFKGRASLSSPRGKWDYNVDFNTWISLMSRAMKDNGSIYMFVWDRLIGDALSAFGKFDFEIKNLITWHKTNPPPTVRKRQWCHSHETIIFAARGKYTFNWLGQKNMHNYIECPICTGNSKERLGHPTQKPVKLLKKFIEVSSNPGDLVFDPFAGVGSTGAAAKELGREYLMIESDEKYYKKACLRLQGKI